MSIKKHKRFLALLSSGRPIPDDLAEWYLSAYNRHKEEKLPLCVCLGIRGAGIRSAKTSELMLRRDFLLKFAASYCTTYPGEKLWSKCGTLAELIKRWPRSRHDNALLPHLFALGVNIPKSQNGIYERITSLGKRPVYSSSKTRGK